MNKIKKGHRVGWDDARILEIESNSRYRKYKESAHMTCLSNSISQPVWTSLLSGSPSSAVRFLTHREDLYDVTDSPSSLECSDFTPQMALVVDTTYLHKSFSTPILFMGAHALVFVV
jgi:hypothetical protein